MAFKARTYFIVLLPQLIFSLLLTVAFAADDGIGLFFLPFGLWKMGFPETVSALETFRFSRRKLSLESLKELINGMGTLMHHLSTALIITAVNLHIFPRSRPLTAACIVPILQHLFVLVKYHSLTVYLILQLSIEAWFQLEVIANVAEFESGLGLDMDNFGRGLALQMLLAHWMYLLGGALDLMSMDGPVRDQWRRRLRQPGPVGSVAGSRRTDDEETGAVAVPPLMRKRTPERLEQWESDGHMGEHTPQSESQTSTWSSASSSMRSSPPTWPETTPRPWPRRGLLDLEA